MTRSSLTVFFVLLLFFQQCRLSYAQVADKPLAVLLKTAEQNYPLLKSKRSEANAAMSGVEVSKKSIIPSLDAAYQLNYATYNNITGMAYPSFFVPISGPPSTENNFSGVFGSAASLLMNWQPITFGQRQAQIVYAQLYAQVINADLENELLQHKVKVANAYLDRLVAIEVGKIYLNNLDRTQANLKLIHSLVKSGIRPDVDTALFRAEVSRSKVDVLNNEKFKQQASIYLSQLIASDNTPLFSDTTYFTRLPIVQTENDSSINPLIQFYQSRILWAKAKKTILAKTTMPVLSIWSTLYTRGSGVSYDGTVNALAGIGFQRYNYGLGLQINVPLLQSLKIKPQIQQQTFLIESEKEKLSEASLILRKQEEIAEATLTNAYQVAKENLLFLESARFSYKAMQSRYQSGLANISDLLQTQYALVKAEIEAKLANMAVWKAFLFKTAIKGDLNIFLNQVN